MTFYAGIGATLKPGGSTLNGRSIATITRPNNGVCRLTGGSFTTSRSLTNSLTVHTYSGDRNYSPIGVIDRRATLPYFSAKRKGFSVIAKDNGVVVPNTIFRLYSRRTGCLLEEKVADVNGSVSFSLYSSTDIMNYYVVMLDNNGDNNNQNAQIYDWLTPS